jgi:hypothetical protein
MPPRLLRSKGLWLPNVACGGLRGLETGVGTVFAHQERIGSVKSGPRKSAFA